VEGCPVRKLTPLCGAVLLMLALTAPVLAVKPFYWYDEDFDDFYPAEGDCGAFVIDVHEVGHHSELLYFSDKTYETVVRTLYQARGTSTLINHVTDKTITGKFSVQCHVDIVTNEPLVYVRRCTGDFFNLSVPGKGLIAHDAGQFTEYVEGEAGASGDILKDVGANWFYEDEVCEALG
jgi:hypothetical protein